MATLNCGSDGVFLDIIANAGFCLSAVVCLRLRSGLSASFGVIGKGFELVDQVDEDRGLETGGLY